MSIIRYYTWESRARVLAVATHIIFPLYIGITRMNPNFPEQKESKDFISQDTSTLHLTL